jgi:hypothetical protein
MTEVAIQLEDLSNGYRIDAEQRSTRHRAEQDRPRRKVVQ